MAISNVERVRSDGFSNSSATCSPARACADGACWRSRRSAFICAAIARSRSRSSSPRSRIDKKSFAKLTGGGDVSIALGTIFAVDAHVLGAQVARPDSGAMTAAGSERDIDPDLRSAQVLFGVRRRLVMW